MIDRVLRSGGDDAKIERVRTEVMEKAAAYPLFAPEPETTVQ
jgi:hypothetical protein